jgi:hypothetical protein
MLTQANPDITWLNCRHSHPLPNREGILSPARIDGSRVFCRGEAGGLYTGMENIPVSACFIHRPDGIFSQQMDGHDNHCSVPAGIASGNIEHFLPLVSPRMLRPFVRSIRRLNLARCDACLAA